LTGRLVLNRIGLARITGRVLVCAHGAKNHRPHLSELQRLSGNRELRRQNWLRQALLLMMSAFFRGSPGRTVAEVRAEEKIRQDLASLAPSMYARVQGDLPNAALSDDSELPLPNPGICTRSSANGMKQFLNSKLHVKRAHNIKATTGRILVR